MTTTIVPITKDAEVYTIDDVKIQVTDVEQVEQKDEKAWTLAELDKEISQATAYLTTLDVEKATALAQTTAEFDRRKAETQARLDTYTALRPLVLAEAEKVVLKEVIEPIEEIIK